MTGDSTGSTAMAWTEAFCSLRNLPLPLIVPAFHDAPCYTLSKTISAERKMQGEWGQIRFTIRDVLRMRRRKQRERTWSERASQLVWRGSSTGTRIDCRKCKLQYVVLGTTTSIPSAKRRPAAPHGNIAD